MKPYKDLQEIFNLAYLGMAKQGWQPSYSDGGCKYLTSDGKRCAIGHAIPDAFITKMPFQGSVRALKFTPALSDPSTTGEYHYNGQIDYLTNTVYFHDAEKVAAFQGVKELFSNVSNKTLEALQSCHDRPTLNDGDSAPETMPTFFHMFAAEHGLTIPDSPLTIPATD